MSKAFPIMMAAGAAFIAIGIASTFYSNVAVEVPLDGTVSPGLTDELSPEMNVGNTLSMQASGSTFDVDVYDPDGNVIASERDRQDFTYNLTAEKAGEYRILVENTGNETVQITGAAQTKSGALASMGPLLLVVTGIIVVGLGLRFRAR
jgi:hypothetical protein